MTRIEIINNFIAQRGYKSYLEIGICDPSLCFDQIICDKKVGVDPDENAKATIRLPSDAYFGLSREMHDFIFIDGLHQYEQVARDIENALAHLNPGGIIMLHDCLPISEQMQTHEWHEGAWCGTTWKAWIRYRSQSGYLTYTLNHDYGCGIIDSKHMRQPDDLRFDVPSELNFDWYVKNVWEKFNIKSEVPENL